MDITQHTEDFATTGQVTAEDCAQLAALGFKTVINNRPNQEVAGQPDSELLQAAALEAGLSYHYLPIVPNQMSADLVQEFRAVYEQAEKPVLAFCRTGNRSTRIYEASQPLQINTRANTQSQCRIAIVGGGAGGIASAASLLKRNPNYQVTIIEPNETHYYQPGWTLVGTGIFNSKQTVRSMASVIPKGAVWLKDSVTEFLPESNEVQLASGKKLGYDMLVVAPGIKIDWDRIEGLKSTLGKNGVASNYDLRAAQEQWRNTQALKGGRAVFTQPPMPIKCAGAPQKAMYLAADYWHKQGCLDAIDIEFFNAGKVLFGVQDYVPALEQYIDKYNVGMNFSRNLVAVDGTAQKAWFENTETNERTAVEFDLLHVSPPQSAPDFIRHSSLANTDGWVDVDQETLQHQRYSNIYSLGDVISAPNAKTAAAVRKQAPVVAHNIHSQLSNGDTSAHYDGYGSCPLLVERGKVVLAEFGYGGKLLPSVPSWVLNGVEPTWLGWILKTKLLPPIYYKLMMRGHEWLATPNLKAHKVKMALETGGASS